MKFLITVICTVGTDAKTIDKKAELEAVGNDVDKISLDVYCDYAKEYEEKVDIDKGTIAAIIALIVAVIVCVVLGFKFGGYFVTPSDDPEKESVQAGNTVSNTAPSTTLGRIPEWTEKETTTKKSEITELVSEEESSTSIFDVPATSQLTPVPDTNRPVINYTPNPNTAPATTQEQTTQEQTTKKPKPTTEKETMEIVEF